MSSLLDRAGRGSTSAKAKNARPTSDAVGPIGLPQVNLLPPEIGAARRLHKTKLSLAAAVAAVLLVAMLGYGYALWQRQQADQALTASQQRTAELTAEQTKYAQVPQITSLLSQIAGAKVTALGAEVLWGPYYDAFAAVLPAGVSVSSLTVATTSTTAGTVATSSGVATLSFTVKTPALPDTAVLMDALSTVPGFTGVTVTTVTKESQLGGSSYTTSGSLQVTTAAYSHRFTTNGGN